MPIFTRLRKRLAFCKVKEILFCESAECKARSKVGGGTADDEDCKCVVA